MAKRKGKKRSAWSNYGDGVQVMDVTFEVSNLDRIRLSEGKGSDSYKKQHEKTVKLINLYNSENRESSRSGFGLSISKARAIQKITILREKEENKQSVIVEE